MPGDFFLVVWVANEVFLSQTVILGMHLREGDATFLVFLVCAGMVATGAVAIMAWRSRLDRLAYERILDEEKEDEVEVGEEEERLLGRDQWRVGS